MVGLITVVTGNVVVNAAKGPLGDGLPRASDEVWVSLEMDAGIVCDCVGTGRLFESNCKDVEEELEEAMVIGRLVLEASGIVVESFGKSCRGR